MSNLVDAFKDYLENVLSLTFGQDLFIGEAPSSNKVADNIWWIVARGGAITRNNATGEKTKERIIEVYRRDRDYKAIYDDMEHLESLLNCETCVDLVGYEILDLRAELLFVDDDLDSEDRKVGLLQVNITLHADCVDGIS